MPSTKEMKSDLLERMEETHGKQTAALLYHDDNLEVLDAALSAAEEELQSFLDQGFTPHEIAEAFANQVRVHLEEELTGATRHGNCVADYRDAVNNGTDS